MEAMKITAVMPVKGRLPLLKHTIGRLIKNNISVVCCGHTDEELVVCIKAGAEFIQVPDHTQLGLKWQLCINLARQENDCDAIMIMGSSDFVSDNWCDVLYPDFDKGYGMTGTAGILFLDIAKGNELSMIEWKGYHEHRIGEPIGTGRMISRKMLDLLDWQLFDRNINSSLDHSTMKKIWAVKDKWEGDPIYCNPSKDIRALSISTYQWVNKHSFLRESLSPTAKRIENPDEVLTKYFPEVVNLFNE